MAGASPLLPAGWVSKPAIMQVEVQDPQQKDCDIPIFIIPRKKVPVVSMTLLQWIISPDPIISTNYIIITYIGLPHLPRTTPVISGCFFPSLEQNSMSSTESSRIVRVEYFLISSCMLVRYWSLSICALSPHTAGPFLLFSARYWMPDISARRRCSKAYGRLMARIASLWTYHTLFHTAHPEHQFLSSSVLYLCHQMKDYRTSHLDGKTRQMTITLHRMFHHEIHEKDFSYTWLVLLSSLTNQTTSSTSLCYIHYAAGEQPQSLTWDTRRRSYKNSTSFVNGTWWKIRQHYRHCWI